MKDATGRGGDQHLADLIRAGSEDFTTHNKNPHVGFKRGEFKLRDAGCHDIRQLFGGPKKAIDRENAAKLAPKGTKRKRAEIEDHSGAFTMDPETHTPDLDTTASASPAMSAAEEENAPVSLPQLFHGLTLYVNGSAAPLVSDHRLKQLWTQHGGSLDVALQRRKVTHVVLGNDAGGGLAAGKIEKEVRTIRGKAIKYVNAQWILDSIKLGKRQPEIHYQSDILRGRTGGSGQRSVWHAFCREDEQKASASPS